MCLIEQTMVHFYFEALQTVKLEKNDWKPKNTSEITKMNIDIKCKQYRKRMTQWKGVV